MGQFNRNIPSTRRVPLEEPARRSVALRKGQVVTTHNRIVVVEDDRGHLAKCSLRRKLGRVVCGDYVEWRTTTRGQGIVESVTRDCKLLERYDARGQHRPERRSYGQPADPNPFPEKKLLLLILALQHEQQY